MYLLSLKTLTVAMLLVNFLSSKKYLVEVGGEEDATVMEDVKEGSEDRGGFDYFYWRKQSMPMPR